MWRPLLVPSSYTLRELHGMIQVAMGWEGIHLYDFELRAARFMYEYDLNIPWRHEVRIEDRLRLDTEKTYPLCSGGSGAWNRPKPEGA